MHRLIFLIFFIPGVISGTVFSSSVPSHTPLKLQRVILATNNNPLYIQFWPIVAPLWQKMGLRPTLALIADETCTVDTTIGDVIRFSPLQGVPESLQAQVIRLLLPILFPDDGCLISDIDMLPISRSYFFDGALVCPEDAFLIYRNCVYNSGLHSHFFNNALEYPEEAFLIDNNSVSNTNMKQYPMCYVAAKGSLFRSVFGISTYQQIEKLIPEWAALGYGWSTDEILLYERVNKWEEEGGGKVVRLNQDVTIPRLDRAFWQEQNKVLDIGRYTDCHCPRPYLEYQQSIDRVVGAIKNLWEKEDGQKNL